MGKIGILTYHNNGNRGAILQAYSLAKSLKKEFKSKKIEIVDYRTLGKEINKLFGATLTRNTPKLILKKLPDYNTSTKFLEKENILSSERIITNSHKKAVKFLKNQDYEMLVVGSDQVWTLEKKNKLLPTYRPFPNGYYLDPSLECFKVSFAASANGTTYKSLSTSEKRTYKKYLSNFDRISVRDEHTENFLEQLGIHKVKRVPDPTLLIDFQNLDLKDILIDCGISLDKPILGIHQCGDITKKIADHYREKGYQIVSPYRGSNVDIELFKKIDPLEYYSIHGYFDFVISKSLHSTIFSIKNGTPFATLDFSNPNMINKKETVLEEFSLLDRHIDMSGKEDFGEVVEEIEKCEKGLDGKHLQQRLDDMKEKGFKYIEELRRMLDEKNRS